jgi:hypothetical protein
MKAKEIILWVAKNKFLHIFLGLITVYAGFSETWETLAKDISSGQIKGGHGVIFIGVLHLLRSTAEFIEAADYLEEGID